MVNSRLPATDCLSTAGVETPGMEEAAAAVNASPAHPWGPVVVNRPALTESRRLKVVAFNAQGGRWPEKIAQVLRRPPIHSPDVILLSEMDWRIPRSGFHEVAAELAAELDMSYAFIGEFAIPRREGDPVSFVGNAILSSRPLSEVRVLPLSKRMTRPRIRRLLGGPAGLAAKVTVKRRPLSLGVVHLNSRWHPAGRELQIRQYLERFPEGEAIFGGDLNSTTVELSSPAAFVKVLVRSLLQSGRFRNPQKWEPLFERLCEAGFDTTGANVNGKPTYTASRFVPALMRPKLDWLALRGLKPVADSAAVIAPRLSFFSTRFSDHDFIYCVVDANENV